MSKRAPRRRRSRQATQEQTRPVSPMLVVAVAVAAIVVVVVAIFLSQRQATSKPATAVQLPSTLDFEVGQTEDGAPYKGAADAKVTIVEYSDYQCPFCRRFFEEIEPQLDEKYIKTGKVKFVYKDFAFLGEESRLAANAALCAQEQGRFWEYHRILFQNQGAENSGAFSRDNLIGFAKEIGLDVKAFTQCLDARKYDPQINRTSQEARKRGVKGTPTFFINDRMLAGLPQFSDLEAAIQSALGESQ